jgi:hypothetical protein
MTLQFVQQVFTATATDRKGAVRSLGYITGYMIVQFIANRLNSVLIGKIHPPYLKVTCTGGSDSKKKLYF